MNDLAFYMEVRFEKNELVFNTREDCNWGKEIVKANPFVEGGRFEVSERAACKPSVIMYLWDLEIYRLCVCKPVLTYTHYSFTLIT